MLKLKINNKNSEIRYENLNLSDIRLSGDSKELIVVTSESHKMRDNDVIKLESRSDDSYYSMFENITVIDGDTFTIPKIDDVVCEIENVEKVWTEYKVLPSSSDSIYTNTDSRLSLVITFSSEHFYRKAKNYYISDFIDENYYLSDVKEAKSCDGDYVWFNGFVFDATVAEDGHYILGDTLMNISDATLEFTFRNVPYKMTGGIVPILDSQQDDTFSLIFFYTNGDSDEDVQYDLMLERFAKNFANLMVTYPDPRYFNVSGDTLYLKDMVSDGVMSVMYKETGNYYLMIPFGETFTIDQNRDELLSENYIDKVKEESINKIVDNEKRQFVPMYFAANKYTTPRYFDENEVLSDSYLKPVNKITFNLHFRKRNNIIGSDGSVLKEWVSEDELAWNNYGIDSNGDLCPGEQFKNASRTNFDNHADLLGYLNFTDDDVYYQKSKLKKSFIRLSFYDSRDRATQSLLFYSTIFLDSGKLYTKYVNAKLSNGSSTNLVSNEQINSAGIVKDDLRLSAQFSCSSKYDMSACSEGFYLYLHPDIVKGAQTTYIYMKVEFNHAKYGRTVPFTMPTFDRDGDEKWTFGRTRYTPITTNSSDNGVTYFPVHYLLTEGNGNDKIISGINTKRLFSDTYIKLGVKYNYALNQYCWFLPRNSDVLNGNELIFNLFEPRINGFEIVERELTGGGENNDGDTIYDYDVQYEVHVQNRLQDQSTIYVKFIIDDAILYSGNIITGQSDIKTGTIKVKRGQETLKCNASTYGCTAETTKDYTYLVYQYSGSHVWADKQPIHGKINNNAVKEENIPLDWISFIFQGQRWIKMYLTIDKWN